MLMIADDAAPQRQHQADGMIGDFAGAVVRRVADGDARFGCSVEVDMIEADAGAHDDAAALEYARASARSIFISCQTTIASQAASALRWQPLGQALAKDVPVDIGAGGAALDRGRHRHIARRGSAGEIGPWRRLLCCVVRQSR